MSSNDSAGVDEFVQGACEIQGPDVVDHVADLDKIVDLGFGLRREVDDLSLISFAFRVTADDGAPSTASVGLY